MIEKDFDKILVHTDPSLVPFDLTFQKASQIRDKIVNTGYVTENTSLPPEKKRFRQVIVSRGGREAGDQLVESCLDAASFLPNIKMVFVRSPKMKKSLSDKIDSCDGDNVEFIPFSKEFEKLLCESSLSISLGGYNTMMNLLRTRTFGLVWAFEKSTEQQLRGKIFQDKGFLRLLEKSDFEPQALSSLIMESMDRSDWQHQSLQLEGSQNSAHEILNTQINQKFYNYESRSHQD